MHEKVRDDHKGLLVFFDMFWGRQGNLANLVEGAAPGNWVRARRVGLGFGHFGHFGGET